MNPAADSAGAQPADALIAAARTRLAEAGIDTPGTDARLLLAHVLGLSHKELSLRLLRGFEVPADQVTDFEDCLARRAAREPLQHITGSTGFRHLALRLGPGVFIPRPETELLIDPAIAHAAALRCGDEHTGNGQARVIRILDMCTGTGALALAAATEIPGSEVHAVELSAEACRWAEHNIAAMADAVAAASSTITLHAGDVAEVVPELGPFDIVVTNPPYVPEATQPDIPEVTGYDPAIALYGGGSDGMETPARIIALAAEALRPGGLLVLEHDETQAAAVKQACAAAGLSGAATHTDYTGRDRFTTAECLERP